MIDARCGRFAIATVGGPRARRRRAGIRVRSRRGRAALARLRRRGRLRWLRAALRRHRSFRACGRFIGRFIRPFIRALVIALPTRRRRARFVTGPFSVRLCRIAKPMRS